MSWRAKSVACIVVVAAVLGRPGILPVQAQREPSASPPPSVAEASPDNALQPKSDVEVRLQRIEKSLERLEQAPMTGLGSFADEATILFGVASLALIIGPLVLVAIGLIERKGLHQVILNETRGEVRQDLDQRMHFVTEQIAFQKELSDHRIATASAQFEQQIQELTKQVDNEVQEMRAHQGYILSELGRVFGNMGHKGDQVVDPFYLKVAIENLEKALKYPSERNWTDKNNLAFYYAIREDKLKALEALKFADELEKRYYESTSRQKHEILDTYAMVAIRFGRIGTPEARERLPNAKRLVEGALETAPLSPEEKVRFQKRLTEVDELLAREREARRREA